MLVPMLEILEKAKEGGYDVLAPNVSNEDSVGVYIEATVELDSPPIVDALPGSHKDITSFGKLVCLMTNEIRIPTTLDPDHGDSSKVRVKAIYGRFTGTMVGHSALSFEEDARWVAGFRNICASLGITMEAESGQIADGCDYEEKRDEYPADSMKIKEFVEKSGCDCLAVPIGEAYGEYTGKGPSIDSEQLKEIRNLADVPLIFHGGPFPGSENIVECCRIGTQKVNMGTDAYNYGLDCSSHGGRYQNGENIGARTAGDIIWADHRERMIDHMKVTGSVGKDWIKTEN